MRKRATAASIAILLVTVAACGGEGTTPTQGPGGTTTTTAAGPGGTSGPGASQPGGPGPGNFPFQSGTGFYEVDGERFVPNYIVRCVPFSFGSPPDERDLDLRGHHSGEGLEIEMSVEDIVAPEGVSRTGYTAIHIRVFMSTRGTDGTEQYEGRAVNHPDGDWYDAESFNATTYVYFGAEPTGPALTPPAGFQVAADRIQGTMTLTQIWPVVTGTVDVTFDYTIPSEEFDCDEL
jgi:hypothetical protein